MAVVVAPFSASTGHLLALAFGVCYVGSLYVSNGARLKFEAKAKSSDQDWPREKLAHERWRDDPDVIRARLTAATVASVICCLMVGVLVWFRTGASSFGDIGEVLKLTFAYLGFRWDSGIWTILPHLVVPLLFLGPLYATYLSETLPGQRLWGFDEHVGEYFFSWIGLRTYIMGPITEEVVFRACVLAVFHMAGISRNHMVYLSPLSFGVAHVHHAWDTYNRYGRTPAAIKRALIGCLFQLVYTSVFGFLAAYLFVQTGSILPATTAHIFCNTMGFPDIQYELSRFPRYRKRIITAYILGIVAFIYTLPRWTGIGDNREFWLRP